METKLNANGSKHFHPFSLNAKYLKRCNYEVIYFFYFDHQESYIWSSRIIHLIIKNHTFNHQESYIWSSRIMHLIIKNHACYDIMNATYKPYALVIYLIEKICRWLTISTYVREQHLKHWIKWSTWRLSHPGQEWV